MPLELYQISSVNISEINSILADISNRLNFLQNDGDNISANNKKFTNLASAVNNTDAVRLSQTFLLGNLSVVLLGTDDEITITDNNDETLTFSLPDSINLDGATASRLLATDGSKKTTSVSTIASWLSSERITIADDGSGGATLELDAFISSIVCYYGDITTYNGEIITYG